MDTDFEADTLSTTGDAEANLGDHDFGDFNLMNLPIKQIGVGGRAKVTLSPESITPSTTIRTGISLMNLPVKHIRAGGRSTINMDTDFEADTLSTTGDAEANLGDHDFGDFQNLAIRNARVNGYATANIDTDYDVDTFSGSGASVLNAGDHDFEQRHEDREDRR